MSFDIAGVLKEKTPKKKQAQHKSIYDKQREEETVRNATNRGYLRRMTVEFLNDNIGIDDRDLPTVEYLNVSSQQLSSLCELEMCISLRICILPGNYITEFDALASCLNLWALDLHGNQIKKVPGHKFWSALKQLQIVLLHDNSITKLQTIQHLSSSPSVLILTLYDTPLSLKKNYRHHVVNGIWSLKALDYFVISDEEVIEDSSMSDPFAARTKNFKIDLSHALTKELSLREAVKYMEELKRKVNNIQAKFCPVLMIQKTFRMFAIRKRYKYLMDTRVWAATSIQRFYRFYKGISKSRDYVLPPPTSPFVPPVNNAHLDAQESQIHGESEDGSGGVGQYDSSCSHKTEENNIHVPVVSYVSSGDVGVSKGRSTGTIESGGTRKTSIIRNKVSQDSRAPISRDISLVTEHSSLANTSRSQEPNSRKESVQVSEGQTKVTQGMTIDLVKLESSATGSIESAACDVTVESGLGLDKKSEIRKESKSRTNASEQDVILIEQRKRDDNDQDDALYRRRLKPERVGKYRTVRVFLGDVVEPKAKKEAVTDSDEDEAIGFRLQGEEPPKLLNEPIAEMLFSKKEIGEDLRKSLRQLSRKQPNKPKCQTGGVMKLTNDQKLFLRTHGTMGLACLRAVHQAYDDRARAQKQNDLHERVSKMKERRELVIERLQSLKQEQQVNVLRERIRDGVKIADTLRENEAKQNEERRKILDRRAAAMVAERMRQSHLTFAREFVCQQNSVSQALRSHDRAEVKKDKLKQLSEAVRAERECNLEKKALVKKYMEHRRLISQAEMLKTKAEINTRLLQEANKQFLETQANTKRAKMRQTNVAELCPLPRLNAPKLDVPLAVQSPALVNQWEESLQGEARHVDDVFL